MTAGEPVSPPAGPARPEDVPTGARWGRARRWLSVVAFVVCTGFLVVAFVDSLGRIKGDGVPDIVPMLVAGGAAAGAQLLAARAWQVLLTGNLDPIAVARTWYVSQVGKYVPGGVVQAAGQITLTRRLGVSWRSATLSYVVLAGGFIVAGLWLGSGVAVLSDDLGPAVRAIVALGFVTPVFLWRPVMVMALGWARRFSARIPPPDDVPAQRRSAVAWVMQIGFMLAQAAAFAVLLDSLGGTVDLPLVLTAFPLAFAAGTLAVPVPSGLAVREAVLVGVLGPSVGSAVVIAAAVWHRIVTIVTDVAMIGANEAHRRLRGRGTLAADDLEGGPGERQPT